MVHSLVGLHLPNRACILGNVIPLKEMKKSMNKLLFYMARSTSKHPSNTLSAIRAPMCICAATGVMSVRTDVMNTPIPNIYRPPNLFARMPPGICEMR